MRHAHLLGARDPVIHRLVSVLVREMGQSYPELVRAEALISETIRLEETRFRRTLERGLGLLDEATAGFGSGDMLDGETAFKLYDTYGFPLDLTQDALRHRGINVSLGGFQDAMARQRAEARASWAGSGEATADRIWFAVKDRVGATEFLGYGTETAEGVVSAILSGDNEVEILEDGAEGSVVVNQTPFYGESGGQVGDAGLMAGDGALFRVTDTQKVAGGLFVHHGVVESGSLRRGQALQLIVEHGRRRAIRANHSATHLLHEALREVLGDHVAQKGSLVAPERLRFDFSHPKPLTSEEISRVEDIANQIVLQNDAVVTRLMAVDEAVASGARALFGEKYGEEVRVVSMGVHEGSERAGRAYSVELCGGTHVGRTGDIGLVTVVGESAVASGVRRLEAVTAEGARRHLLEQDKRLRDVASVLRVPQADIVARVETLVDERRRLEKELADARKKLALGDGSGSAGGGAEVIGDVRFLGRAISGVAPKDLKGLVDEAKSSIGSGIVAIVGVSDDGKAGLVVGITSDLVGRFDAVDLVKVGSEVLGGKGGGGRADMAQAGGPDGSRAGEAVAAVAERIRAKA
jgi:alanyl-tRNA synthetase